MFTSKKIGKSFQYPFEGDNWFSNMIISGLLFLSGIGIFAINGNGLELMRKMVTEKETDQSSLDWNNLGENFLDGIKLAIVFLIWKLPLLILRTILLIVNIIILIAAIDSDSGAGMAIFFLIWFISGTIALLYKLALSGLRPVITGEVAANQSIQSGLMIKKIFNLSKSAYWRNIGLNILSSFLFFLTFVAGSQLFSIGTVITMPYAYDVKYHLFGQSYLASLEEDEKEQKEEKQEKKTTAKKSSSSKKSTAKK